MLIYLGSIGITWFLYPAGPIRDEESGEKIGETYGVTKMNLFMIVPFSMINNFCFNNINVRNGMGIRPEYEIDLFAINLFTMFVYSFSHKGLYFYLTIPMYGLYKISGYIK